MEGNILPTIDELKYLSERRLEAANILSENNIHDIAYHDSGYIIELGLKAAICKRLEVFHYPENESQYRTHHFDSLVSHAGLSKELAKKKSKDRDFMKNWSIATKWSVALRYQPTGVDEENISKTFLNAIESEKGGVLPWIKAHW
jgi:DNA gyrase/topoisomerase IV subunit B